MEQFSQIDILLLALSAIGLGIWLLVRGGDSTVDAASAIAQKFNIPTLVIGFTIVAFGTSLPELIVSINANFRDSAGIALGNVIGSNIANILLVVGAAAVAYPVIVKRSEIWMDTAKMILISLFFSALLFANIGVSSLVGMVMLLALFAYVTYQLWNSKHHAPIDSEQTFIEEDNQDTPLWRLIIILVVGLAAVALGADVLVRGAIIAATILGVPDALIGLSVIALGTSLPELATSIAAAMKKQSGLIIGSILGSNVFNILLIIGAASSLKAIPDSAIAAQMTNFDVWVMSGIAVIFGLSLIIRQKIGRLYGLFMLAAYIAYITALYFIYSPSALG